jgi:hypothetical protein
MVDEPLDLDSHRGMAAQKATDVRRVLAEVEAHARELARAPGRSGRLSFFGSRSVVAGGSR